MPVKKIIVEPSERLFKFPDPLGDQFEGLIKRVDRRGLDIIDLGKINIHFPDHLKPLLKIKQSQIWGNNDKQKQFEDSLKEKLSSWLESEYQVKVDPLKEMLLTTGNTPGMFMAFMSLLDKNSRAYIPDPSYSLYRSCADSAGAETETYLLSEINDFLPNLEKLKSRLTPKKEHKTATMVINYPHNPTSKGADLKFYDKLSSFARKYNLLIFSDSVYVMHGGDGFSHPLYMQSEHGKATGIEFLTFSFLFNLPSFKIGVAIGNKELLSPLAKFRKTFNLIPSVFDIEITNNLFEHKDKLYSYFTEMYNTNRELVYNNLDQLGWEYLYSNFAPFVWIKLPRRRRIALNFCRMLLKRTGVIVLPGTFFGDEGEGFMRLALGQPSERIQEAFDRIGKYSRIYKVTRSIKARKRKHD